MRVAVYARVSTEDRGQDPENQLAQLRAWCAAAGHEIAAEYIDHASGGKGADRRPRFAAMLDDAHRRRFDMVLVWALDRLTREGMVATVGYLQRLAAAGVAFHSYSEPAYAATTRWCGISCSRSWPRWRRRSAPGSASAPGRDWRECGRGGRGGAAGAAGAQWHGADKDRGWGVRSNPDMTAYAIAKAVGCDVKTAAMYRAPAPT